MIIKCKLGCVIEKYNKFFDGEHFANSIIRCNYDSIGVIIR